MEPLKVALLGLHGVGADYLTAIRSDDRFHLIAVGEKDAERLRRLTEGTPVSAFQDFRSLIVESDRAGLDVLFVALEPHESQDYLKMAADRGVGVYHKVPFARHLTDARQIVGWFDACSAPLVVSRPWQFEPAFRMALDSEEPIGRLFAASACVQTTDVPEGWRGDSARAAGGVLLHGAYTQLDLLVHLMGIPESVFTQCCHSVPPGKARSYDTEDVAQICLRFTGQRTAVLSAFRHARDASWQITLVGENGAIGLNDKRLQLEPHDDRPRKIRRIKTECRVAPAIGAFAAACLSDDMPFASTATEHLTTMAVIEAAYLSAKTGTPESPRQF